MSVRKVIVMLMLIAALFAARCFAWAEAATLNPGALQPVDLGRGAGRFRYTPEDTALYDICAYPAEGFEGEVSAALYRDGELLEAGSGSLTLFSRELEAGTTYEIVLSGAGRIWLEAARHALSRCFDDPKVLNAGGDDYDKAIVKPGDVHWYALTADESRPLLLSGIPRETASGLRLEARLFSAAGRVLAEATRTAGGAMLMDFMPRAGRRYRLRVSAPSGGTGLYTLRVSPGEGGLPEALMLSEDSVILRGRESRALRVSAIPEGAAGPVLWESSDDQVVSVSQEGVLTGRRPGTAVVTAYAAGAVRTRCRVEVAPVPVTGVELITGRIHMNVGDDLALEWRTLPETASDPRVRFALEPEGIAAVDAAGVLRALEVGHATLTVSTRDGGYAAVGDVYVAPARKRYRALLVGEQSYAPEVASVRLGSANSVSGMRSMLSELIYQDARFEITTALDISRQGVLEAVAAAFDGATDRDTALFYITCHGYYAHGMTVFQMYDGSELTAPELRRALERVPGEIIVLLDCCGSGGALDGLGAPEDILRGVDRVFGGLAGPSAFGSSRYRVLASALVEQDSYRISFEGSAQETGMATLFARAVCEGCGWNIDRAQRRAMLADVNYDDVVSLDELFNYARRRVMWYLSLTGAGYAQTITAFPQGDVSPLFERVRVME